MTIITNGGVEIDTPNGKTVGAIADAAAAATGTAGTTFSLKVAGRVADRSEKPSVLDGCVVELVEVPSSPDEPAPAPAEPDPVLPDAA